jgi:hypothetical protein
MTTLVLALAGACFAAWLVPSSALDPLFPASGETPVATTAVRAGSTETEGEMLPSGVYRAQTQLLDGRLRSLAVSTEGGVTQAVLYDDRTVPPDQIFPDLTLTARDLRRFRTGEEPDLFGTLVRPGVFAHVVSTLRLAVDDDHIGVLQPHRFTDPAVQPGTPLIAQVMADSRLEIIVPDLATGDFARYTYRNPNVAPPPVVV